MSIENQDAIIMAKVRECLNTPAKYGYSDLMDFLAEYLIGDDSLNMFLWNCNVTYLGSTEPAPER